MFDLSDTGFIGFGNFKAIITDRNFDFVRIVINTLVWVFFFFDFPVRPWLRTGTTNENL